MVKMSQKPDEKRLHHRDEKRVFTQKKPFQPEEPGIQRGVDQPHRKKEVQGECSLPGFGGGVRQQKPKDQAGPADLDHHAFSGKFIRAGRR